MKKHAKKLLSTVLVLAMIFTFTIIPAGTAQAAKTTYLTRAQAVKIINETLGITKYSNAKMANVTDMNAKSSYYKTMARAVNAGLVSPNSKGKLSPASKATYKYVAAILAKADDTTTAKMLGGYTAGTKLTEKTLKKFINKRFPTVLSKSSSKVSKGNVIINKPGVTLSNTKVNGNLIIADGVGNKEVTLDNVTVTGKVIVRGGGANSFIIKGNSSIASIIVKALNYKVSIKVQDRASVSVIRVPDGSNDVNIVGTVGSLIIDCADINVTLSAAKIGTVTVTENAKGATVDADKDSSVENVVVNAEGTKVTGDGEISGVEVNAPNTTVDASSVDADKVKVSGEASDVTVNGEKVKAGETNTNTNTGTSTGSSSGSSSGSSASNGSGSSSGSSSNSSSGSGTSSSSGSSSSGNTSGGSGSSSSGSGSNSGNGTTNSDSTVGDNSGSGDSTDGESTGTGTSGSSTISGESWDGGWTFRIGGNLKFPAGSMLPAGRNKKLPSGNQRMFLHVQREALYFWAA